MWPYCERLEAGFWGEPINALTNFAFLIAAGAVAVRLARRRVSFAEGWDLWLLAGLIALIGLGSFLWHTFATTWARIADLLPIFLTVNVFLLSFLARIAGLRPLALGAAFLAFNLLGVAVLVGVSVDLWNQSIIYFPAFLGLFGMALFTLLRGRGEAAWFTAGLVAVTAALVMRSVDLSVCGTWPVGTHFLWHLLGALALYLVTTGLATAAVDRKQHAAVNSAGRRHR